MKKILLFGGLTLALGFASCTKDGYRERTQTIVGPAINIITSLDDGSVIASNGSYSYSLKITDTDMTGTITSSELIADNMSLGFTSEEATYKSTNYDAYFENITATAGNTGMQIRNSVFQALYMYDENLNKYGYYFDLSEAGDYTFSFNPYALWITIAKYDIGSSFRVNTFPVNTFFKGTTTTSYASADGIQNFTTEGITYRFIVDAEKKTAVMVIYNAKFSASPQEPTKAAIIAEGLTVDFQPSGIHIYGSDIIPGMVEGQNVTPNKNYVFNNIEFNTTDSYYTEGELDYLVAGRYTGHFEGAYMNSYYIK